MTVLLFVPRATRAALLKHPPTSMSAFEWVFAVWMVTGGPEEATR